MSALVNLATFALLLLSVRFVIRVCLNLSDFRRQEITAAIQRAALIGSRAVEQIKIMSEPDMIGPIAMARAVRFAQAILHDAGWTRASDMGVVAAIESLLLAGIHTYEQASSEVAIQDDSPRTSSDVRTMGFVTSEPDYGDSDEDRRR